MPAAPKTWHLTLRLQTGRVLACLSDGGALAVLQDWAAAAPEQALLLPAALRHRIEAEQGVQLRLQLDPQLDPLDWEELPLEQGALAQQHALSRHVAGAARATQPPAGAEALLPGPQGPWVLGAEQLPAAGLARWGLSAGMVEALVVLPRQSAVARRGSLQRLREAWLHEGSLAAALLALRRQGLLEPGTRLYGDATAPLAAAGDDEHLRQATALAFDLAGSTHWLARLGSEGYAQQLASFHACCRSIVERFGGRVDEPQGDDGLMSYFGFPAALDDAAWQAAQAAWAITRAVPQLGMAVRVGVASGPMAVRARQAHGLAIHLAARLCDRAPLNAALLDEATADRLAGRIALREQLLPEPLEGLGEVRRCHLLCGVQAPSERPDRAPLLGRDPEWQALQQAWQQASLGQRSLLCLEGEAGMGKSRLLREFALELETEGAQLLLLNTPFEERHHPYAGLRRALRREFGLEPEAGSAQVRERLLGQLPEALLQRWPQAAVLLDELLDSPDRPPQSAGDAAQRRQQTQQLLLDWLQGLLAAAPLALLVDDAHWLDPSSEQLLQQLLSDGTAGPLCVVIGHRPEGYWPWLQRHGARRLALRGLDDAAAAELLRHVAGAAPEPSLLAPLLGRAGGVPLFLEEAARILADSGGLAGLGRASGAGGAGAQLDRALAGSLHDVLQARLDRLGPARRGAELAALLGREFPLAWWQALLALDHPVCAAARAAGGLQPLLDQGVLERREQGRSCRLQFRHVLIGEVAYASLWQRDRAELHRRFAALLQQQLSDAEARHPARRAEHWAAAGEREAAALAFAEAAQQTARHCDHREAIQFAEQGLAQLDAAPAERQRLRCELHLLQAAQHIALQGYGAAAVELAYLRAQACAADSPPAVPVRILLGLEACAIMRGDLPRARQLAEQALKQAATLNDARLELQARWAHAHVLKHQGELRPSLAAMDDCLARYQTALHQRGAVQDPGVMCLCYSAWSLWEAGDAAAALARVERLLTLAEALDHPFSWAEAHGFAAALQGFCGRHEAAVQQAELALRHAEAGGFAVWRAHARMVRGRAWGALGRVEAARREMAEAHADWLATGGRITSATYLAWRAELELAAGRPAAAADLLAEAWRTAMAIGEHYYLAEIQRLRARCLPDAAARPLLQRACELAQQQGALQFALRAALDAAARGFDAATLQGLLPLHPARHGAPELNPDWQRALAWLTDHQAPRGGSDAQVTTPTGEPGRAQAATRGLG